jgi:hypothetical protein
MCNNSLHHKTISINPKFGHWKFYTGPHWVSCKQVLIVGHKQTDMTFNKFKSGWPIQNFIYVSPELITTQEKKKLPIFFKIVMVKKLNFKILTELHILGP